jgi:hypothetical protein
VVRQKEETDQFGLLRLREQRDLAYQKSVMKKHLPCGDKSGKMFPYFEPPPLSHLRLP